MIKNKHLPLTFLLCLIVNFSFSQNYYEEGKKEYHAENYSRSIELFTKAILNDQEIAKSLLLRGASKIFLDQYDDAFTDLESSKQVDSTNPSLLLKQYADAIKDLTVSLKIKPRQQAYANRGLAWSFLNEQQKAIEDYTQSLAINPQDGEIYCYRGKSYKALGKKAEACADLKKSSELGYSQAGDELKELKCDQ